MRQLFFSLLILLSAVSFATAQLEDVPVAHPVYDFIISAEAKGLLRHFSTSSLPLRKQTISDALRQISESRSELSEYEKETLEIFLKEFEVYQKNKSGVLVYSSSERDQILSSLLFSGREKLIYKYSDTATSVNISPLASIEYFQKAGLKNENVSVGNLGFRIFGTIENHLGYYLQATNGRIISGNKDLALEDSRYSKSIKFTKFNSDIDLTESHVRYVNKWFSATIGRETRLVGSGITQRDVISSSAPPMDALVLGAHFSNFEYTHTFASLIGYATTQATFGYPSKILVKYMASNRFMIKPEWGDIAFWESVIYSDRFPDLAYLNPLSFMKSLEHALRDRDNALMGLDFTIRPIRKIQIKSSFLLDDIIIEKIGEGFWSNKTAFNAGITTSHIKNLDLGFEYARVEPYTFSHFNYQNSVTNDSLQIGSFIPPNSEEWSIAANWWFGGRYPLRISFSYLRHGDNIYDADGKLLKNVGGDVRYARRNADPGAGIAGDSETVKFLDGNLSKVFRVYLTCGIELWRGFNLHGQYLFSNDGRNDSHKFVLTFRFDDF